MRLFQLLISESLEMMGKVRSPYHAREQFPIYRARTASEFAQAMHVLGNSARAFVMRDGSVIMSSDNVMHDWMMRELADKVSQGDYSDLAQEFCRFVLDVHDNVLHVHMRRYLTKDEVRLPSPRLTGIKKIRIFKDLS